MSSFQNILGVDFSGASIGLWPVAASVASRLLFAQGNRPDISCSPAGLISPGGRAASPGKTFSDRWPV